MTEFKNKKIPLQEWVRILGEDEMPVFAHTARNIAAVSGKIETPIAELAHLILQDSAMTTRVLRLANSVYYNPGGERINTVSLAILMLGFDVVRNIALTIAMIDIMFKGIQHEHVIEEMARSLHAAVQAKAIASARGIAEVEEVFIAALLYRLGHLAFWCFPQEKERLLDAEYSVSDTEEKAEVKILGFTLTQLTILLNKEWHLSKVLAESLLDPELQCDSINDIDKAYQLVTTVEQGWGSLEARQAIKDISQHTSLSMDDTLEMVQKSSELAAQTAIEYGAINASKLINLPQHVDLNIDETEIIDQAYQPDLSLQLSILRELTVMLTEKCDLNIILGTVLEGIYRSLAMERTVLAFLSNNETRLTAKYVYGKDEQSVKTCFNFTLNPDEKNIFSYIIKQKKAFWINDTNQDQFEPYLTTDIKKCLGTLTFFASPLLIGNRVKGIIYSDCKFTGRKLSDQDFQSFSHFCEHANIALELMSKRSK
ncbi:MAG: HDOD domain-containing protein [Gammaproteobacteria bacterium]|nr:HDOD domain-containing protein [Gammaproteobacteria bacterium]